MANIRSYVVPVGMHAVPDIIFEGLVDKFNGWNSEHEGNVPGVFLYEHRDVLETI